MITISSVRSDGRSSDPKAAEPSESQAVGCPHCGEDLEIHQPDPDLVDRLLLTCEHCKSWFMSDGNTTRLSWISPVPVRPTPLPPRNSAQRR